MAFCCCSPSTVKFDILYILGSFLFLRFTSWSSRAMTVLTVNVSKNDSLRQTTFWVCEARHQNLGAPVYAFRQLEPIWQFFLDLSYQQGVSTHKTVSHWMFLFFRTMLCKLHGPLCMKFTGKQQFMRHPQAARYERLFYALHFFEIIMLDIHINRPAWLCIMPLPPDWLIR